MGIINLFAHTLTEPVADFLAGYREGLLHLVSAVRVLDEKPFPHSYIKVAALNRSFIVVEVADPLLYADIDWLYRAVIVGEYEYNKSSAMRYSIERCLNPIGTRNPRRKVESEAEWERIRAFRRKLEVPMLALKHLKDTFLDSHEDGSAPFLKIEKHPNVLVIEYDAKPVARRKPAPAKDAEAA